MIQSPASLWAKVKEVFLALVALVPLDAVLTRTLTTDILTLTTDRPVDVALTLAAALTTGQSVVVTDTLVTLACDGAVHCRGYRDREVYTSFT